MAALLAACAGAACYAYQPVPAGMPPTGASVRLTLTDEEALRLSRETGELARSLAGLYTGGSADTIYLAVATFRTPAEVTGSRQMRRAVAVPRAGVEDMATRELSLVRSGIVGAFAVTGMVLVANQIVAGGFGGSGDDGDDGNPTGTMVPVLRIPFRR